MAIKVRFLGFIAFSLLNILQRRVKSGKSGKNPGKSGKNPGKSGKNPDFFCKKPPDEALFGARDEKFGQNPLYGHRSQIFGFYCIFITKYFTK